MPETLHIGRDYPKVLQALREVGRGHFVFPCAATSKQPRWKWGTNATNDRDKVLRWWGANPHDNIGIACKPSGLVVLDLDTGHARHQVLGEHFGSGALALAHIARRCGMSWPMTYTVETPSGGRHLYFRAREGLEVGNRPLLGAAGLIDVRAAGGEYGGYVLAPESTNEYYERYRAQHVFDTIVPLPGWLWELLKPPPPKPPRPESEYDQPEGNWDALVERVDREPPGNRNALLFWAAATMFEKGVAVERVKELLLPVVTDLGAAADNTIMSARDTVERHG